MEIAKIFIIKMNFSMKVAISCLLIAILAQHSIQSQLLHESQFQLEHYTGHSWFNDMVSNSLRNHIVREQIVQTIADNSSRDYRMFTTSVDSLK